MSAFIITNNNPSVNGWKSRVVLIGDTLLSGTKDYSCGHKIFREFPGIVIALASDRAISELLKSNILDFLKSQRLINNLVSTERFLISMSQIARRISEKHVRLFDILLAISGTLIGGVSSLHYMVPTGETWPIPNYSKIGSDSPRATALLKKLFRCGKSTKSVDIIMPLSLFNLKIIY